MSDIPRRNWTVLALTTLTIVLGFQMLRLLPTYIFFIATTLPFVTSTAHLGLIGLGTVVIGSLLAGISWRAFGPRASLIATAGGLGLMRLLVQLAPEPIVDLPFLLVGAALFMAYLAVGLGVARQHGWTGGAELALGILLGLALDTGVHGMWRTYDLAWQTDTVSNIVEYVLIALQLFALMRSRKLVTKEAGPEAGLGASLAFAGIGSVLFLHMLQFQNVARLTAFIETPQSRWPQAVAFGLIVAANALAIVVSLQVGTRSRPDWTRQWWGALALGILMIVGVSLTPPEQPLGVTPLVGLLNALGLVAGSAVSAFMLTILLSRLAEGDKGRGLWRTTAGSTLASVLYIASVFVYQASYDIRMPFSNAIVPPIVAALLAFMALRVGRKLAVSEQRVLDWRPSYAAVALIALPVLLAILTPTPFFEQGDGGPLRIVDYNLHMGFDTHGRLGMQALADVVLDNEADIVVLQEVSRGWLVTGSLDMLSWLSYRLDMPYVWGPTADAQWGSAILSRFPIEDFEIGLLPRGPVALRRGYMAVNIDYGADERVRIIGTHLHHTNEDTEVRIPQVERVLEVWDGTPRTLVIGDMNARPGEADLVRFSEAGLVDVYAAMGYAEDEGLTFISSGPYERIDWIFATPDVTYLDFEIPQTAASDHLPLVTTVELP